MEAEREARPPERGEELALAAAAGPTVHTPVAVVVVVAIPSVVPLAALAVAVMVVRASACQQPRAPAGWLPRA